MSHASGNAITWVAPKSKLYQGPFGRICPNLPPWSPPGVSPDQIDQHFLDFVNTHMVERPGKNPAEIAGDPAERNALEAEFASTIPAGYTYFGQFVDHDITFDPMPLGMRMLDPNALENFRTPRLDLDNVYGRGPADQPYLYDPSDKDKLVIADIAGTPFKDLPRFGSVALIGDMRNDENSIVSQLQVAFLAAHNTLVDRARDAGFGADAFERARMTLRWLYQHVVWNDFIKRIAINDVYSAALQKKTTPDGRKVWELGLKDVYNWKNTPFMPVEFAGAAYRFGHSMVRNDYQTNFRRGFGVFAPIFDNTAGSTGDNLRGFRPMSDLNVIEWDWFLPMTTSAPGLFPQMARKIDTKLANALTHLHEAGPGSPMNVLAFRNLKRGWTLGLPSGTDVARKLCIKPIALEPHEPDALWYYVLKEAGTLPGGNAGNMLGRVGSTIVCAVFAGLLKGDPMSWVNMDPDWTPGSDPLLQDGVDNIDDASWTLASIIRLSGLPTEAGQFPPAP